MYLALSVFGVSQHVNFHVKLIDWMETPIRDDIFMDFIEKYNNVPNFFIELVYRVDFENTVKVVTPFVSVSLIVVERPVHTCVRLLSKIFLRFSVQTHCCFLFVIDFAMQRFQDSFILNIEMIIYILYFCRL